MASSDTSETSLPASPSRFRRFVASIWLFPGIMTALLLLLTLFQISGSSIGMYHDIFYGDTKGEDSSLIAGQPRGIRSDEWLASSQMIIAQKNNDFQRINQNVGNGEDVSLIIDVPYKEWSAVFKPHDAGFFVMPFDNAFAFRWWAMGYLVVLSCYFFVLALLPGRRMLAALLSLGLFFSPFVQWWYAYGTLGSLYYSLFIGAILIKLTREKRLLQSALWGLLLTYIATCFILILYPPFQIPCALVLAALGLGILIEQLRDPKIPRRHIWQRLGIVAASLAIAGGIALTFFHTRPEAIQAITNTAYPGQRSILSGGYDLPHLLSGHLSMQLQYSSKAAHYVVTQASIANQSEAAGFILVLPFLLLPGIILIARGFGKKQKIDWPLLITTLLFGLLMIRLFVPHFNTFFKLLLLDKVPHNRLIIGLGLLGIVYIVLFIRNLLQAKKPPFQACCMRMYVCFVFLFELAIGWYVTHAYPGFISMPKAFLLAIPIPVVVYLLLTKRFVSAALGLALFGMLSSAAVNPLYHGTDVVTDTPISKEIRAIAQKNDGRWATEHFLLENFAYMNGARSLTGVYTYPQLSLWKGADPLASPDVYNRYAHTVFAFDRNPETTIPTTIALGGGDSFGITTEPCSDFLKERGVRYLLAGSELKSQDTCATLIKKVHYPAQNLFIYRLTF